jgi:hypothetical protein
MMAKSVIEPGIITHCGRRAALRLQVRAGEGGKPGLATVAFTRGRRPSNFSRKFSLLSSPDWHKLPQAEAIPGARMEMRMAQIEIGIEIVGPDRAVLTDVSAAFEQADGYVKRLGPKTLLEFLPDVQHLIGYTAGAGGAAVVLKSVTNIATAWIKGREGRKVTLTLGRKKIDVHGPGALKEAKALLEEMEAMEENETAKRKPTPRSTARPEKPQGGTTRAIGRKKKSPAKTKKGIKKKEKDHS